MRAQDEGAVVAVPVAAPSVCAAFRQAVADAVCAITPEHLYAIGLWYEDFAPTSDREVQELLRRAEERTRGAVAAGSSRERPGGAETAGPLERADSWEWGEAPEPHPFAK